MKSFAFLSFAALMAPLAVLAQSGSDCIAMCMQVKFNELASLTQCDGNDLNCLCSDATFGKSFARCLSDNCQESDVDAGKQLFGQICSDAGVALNSFTAATDNGAKQTAVGEMASLLGASISGDAPPPAVTFFTDSAISYGAAAASSNAAAAASSAQAAISKAERLASLSLQHEAEQISQSFQRVVQAASATQAALATQYSGSAYDQITSQIAATLSIMQQSASSQLAADQAAASSSLAAQSSSLLQQANPTGNVQNAASSSATRLQIQAGLGFLALLSGLWLI